jgi:hypothetical protein
MAKNAMDVYRLINPGDIEALSLKRFLIVRLRVAWYELNYGKLGNEGPSPIPMFDTS